MNKTIRILFVLSLVFISIFCSGCVKEMTMDDVEEHLSKANAEGVAKLREDIKRYEIQGALANGDTYCKDCDKYIEGKVRICTYCGQYIK